MLTVRGEGVIRLCVVVSDMSASTWLSGGAECFHREMLACTDTWVISNGEGKYRHVLILG